MSLKNNHHTSKSVSIGKLMLISILAYILFLVVLIVGVIATGENQVVPLTGLPQSLHITVLTIIWPIVGGFLGVYFFPKILVPLFLKSKHYTRKNYTDCVISLERPINFKLVLQRAFMVFLLVMGLESAVMPLLDIRIFYMPSQLSESGIVEDLLPYNPQAFIVTAALIFPFALLLWVLVWSIQDSGLMHYQLSEDSTKYQEIEPVYLQIYGYIRGYAGISSIFFYLNALYQILKHGLSEWLNFVWILFVSIIVIIWSMPFIVLYSSRKLDWVTRDVKKIARLKIEDLKFLDDMG